MAARQAEGILDYGSSNQIGGPVPAAGNLISGNNWGVRLDGSSATANLVEGNLIGTDITGKVTAGQRSQRRDRQQRRSANTIGGTCPSLATPSPSTS